MPTVAQITTAVSNRLTALWPTLVAKQTAYFNLKGKYFQGIKTHDITPDDGVDADADLTKRPTDQIETWADFGVATFKEGFSLEIHSYNGPLGPGFVAILSITKSGKTWSMSKNYGPENRDRAWTEIIIAAL